MSLPTVTTPAWTGTDNFSGTALDTPWEWNHNPDTTKFIVNDGLTLFTATVTSDIFTARNTLTYRVFGPLSTAIMELDTSKKLDGDSAGFAAFRDWTAYIEITRSGSTYTISNVQSALQNSTNSLVTITDGLVAASAPIPSGKVWLRGVMNAAASSNHQVSFQYSTDGMSFKSLGMNTDYTYFIGYRWGIFNFATKVLRGLLKNDPSWVCLPSLYFYHLLSTIF